MKHIWNLLVELKKRENMSKVGEPITDSDFNNAFKWIKRSHRLNYILFDVIIVMVFIIITLL